MFVCMFVTLRNSSHVTRPGGMLAHHSQDPGFNAQHHSCTHIITRGVNALCHYMYMKVYHRENSDRQRGACMSSLHSGCWDRVSEFKACLGLYSKSLSQNPSNTVDKNTKLSCNFLEERTLGHTGHQYNARNDNKPTENYARVEVGGSIDSCLWTGGIESWSATL